MDVIRAFAAVDYFIQVLTSGRCRKTGCRKSLLTNMLQPVLGCAIMIAYRLQTCSCGSSVDGHGYLADNLPAREWVQSIIYLFISFKKQCKYNSP